MQNAMHSKYQNGKITNIMVTESLFKGCYVTCAYDHMDPYGRMVCSYSTLEEANEHIRYQKEHMGSKANWSILHIKDMEWITPSV